jgi:hypothetical protein
MSAKTGDVLIETKPVTNSNIGKLSKSLHQPEYLDEYDEYGLENEKFYVGGQGGKQRTKKDIVQNVKNDPSGNVRKITSNLQNFEHNRRSK